VPVPQGLLIFLIFLIYLRHFGGSGKSSVLECLRYTLNIPFGEKAQDRDYKDALVPYVLKSGGKVVVEARVFEYFLIFSCVLPVQSNRATRVAGIHDVSC
jgi:hypothetical protein